MKNIQILRKITLTLAAGRKIKLAFLGIGYDSNNLSPATILMSYNEDKLPKQ